MSRISAAKPATTTTTKFNGSDLDPLFLECDPAVVVQGVPGAESLIARLGQAEFRRRLCHITPGFLPLLLWIIPHTDPWGPPLRGAVLLIAGYLTLSILRRFATMSRAGENGLGSVLGYAGTVLATLLLFPGREEIGLTVLAVLAFGDGCATLGGLLFQGPALPWNREKTWAGLASFCVMGSVMGTIIYWGESRPMVSWSAAAACGLSATVLAAAAESIPSRINDNIRVGLAAAVGAVAMHATLFGWH